MFIQTEETPNPRTLKFIPGVDVISTGSMAFNNAEDAKRSPLAKKLFEVEGIEGVFFGRDFITVMQSGNFDWKILKAPILTYIMEHFVSGIPLINENINTKKAKGNDAGDCDIVTQIKDLLDKMVRPAVAQDGGDIIFHSFENGIVYLEMHGACSGCPSASATLKHGVENLLCHYIPEVIAVESINDIEEML